jgi:tetratricopeptide (TPR) repeat protein
VPTLAHAPPPTATPPGEEITDPDYLAGKTAYQEGNFQEVTRLMELVLARDPNLAPAHWYRGMAYYQLGDYAAALGEMEVALQIDPAYALAYADRGLQHRMLGNDNRAYSDWQKALELEPTLAKVHHYLGLLYAENGDQPRAMEAYRTAVAIDPTRSDSWQELAAGYQEAGQFQECADSAGQAIQYGVEEKQVHFTRGFCLIALEQYEAALLELDVYVGHVTVDSKGWYQRALVHRELGNDEQAVADFTQSIGMDTGFPPAYIERGDAYLSLGELELALADYEHVLGFGEIPQAYMGRGAVFQARGEIEAAVEAYEKAALLSPGSATHGPLATLYLEQGDYQRAVDSATQALLLNPGEEEARILLVRGRAYLGLDDCERARGDLVRSVTLSPEPLAYYYRGVVYHECENPDLAIPDLEFFMAAAGPSLADEIADARARLEDLKP